MVSVKRGKTQNIGKFLLQSEVWSWVEKIALSGENQREVRIVEKEITCDISGMCISALKFQKKICPIFECLNARRRRKHASGDK
jgi:hypothetical protein